MQMLFSWSDQDTGSVRLDTAVHLSFDRIIHRTPQRPRAMQVRASYGPCMGIFNVFHIPWHLCGAGAGPTRVPYGMLMDT